MEDNNNNNNNIRYRLFGSFWLSPPVHYLDKHSLIRLQQLEPHFRMLEAAQSPGSETFPKPSLDVLKSFHEFQELESRSWTHYRRSGELVPPSGSLEWPIAHHLHNPSFQTLTPHNGETEDATTSCIWMIIANNFVPGKTLIFDHLSRRESIDGLEVYPRSILKIHEDWVSEIRTHMAAKVEIIYGKKVRDRMLQIHDLEPLALWGEYKSVVLYLEWVPSDDAFGRRLARVIVPAYHPQVFLCPGGARYATHQDTVLRIAHELAGLNDPAYKDGFYRDFNTTMINKSGIRPHHYKTSQDLAGVAEQELNRNLASMSEPAKLRSMSRAQLPPTETALAYFKETKVSEKYIADPTKPAVIKTKCKVCGLPNKDYQPLWCIKTGKYIARRKKCTDQTCVGCLSIPQDAHLSYIAYCGTKISTKALSQDTTQTTFAVLRQPTILVPGPSKTAPSHSPAPSPKLLLDSPLEGGPVQLPSKGYNQRENSQFGQPGERGPFKFWHGRMPVMTKMGRVRIWVLRGAKSADMKIKRLDISTYGEFLLKSDCRILEFNKRGISLVSSEGKELWHASLEKLRRRKNNEEIVKQHTLELKEQQSKV